MRNPPVVDTLEHYERLVDEGSDADSPALRDYMQRWDGPLFFEALGNLTDKDVLEIGVGTGRVAREVLGRGCRSLTGIDFSLKTIERAKANLADYPNIEFDCCNIEVFDRPAGFDVVYSVLTFMHIEDKPRGLANVVRSLRSGGRIVLSVAEEGEWLDFGSRLVRLHYEPPGKYVGWLKDVGCEVAEPVDLIDRWVWPNGKKEETYGKKIATLIQGRKLFD